MVAKDGERIGEGWHRFAGGPHAEIEALAQAGEQARGASCYVTLEPCCHQGRTPACTEALISAGVRRVVAAMRDPNPQVSAQGLAVLKRAEISVDLGLFEDQARELNAGFCARMTRERPYVVCKLAASLDGRTAMPSGESKWITSEAARSDVQRLRARSSAVMTGIATVLADDPALTVRDPAIDLGGRQPLRVVIDSRLRLPNKARLLALPGSTCVITTERRHQSTQALTGQGVQIVRVPERDGLVDLHAGLKRLARLEVNEVLLEAGPRLSGAMLQAGLVDELVLYLAPRLLGDNARGLVHLPGLERLAESLKLEITDMRAVGPDWRITAKVLGQEGSREELPLIESGRVRRVVCSDAGGRGLSG